jgi:hypothetical protein
MAAFWDWTLKILEQSGVWVAVVQLDGQFSSLFRPG